MRIIDLPQCSFNNCKYCFGYCRSNERYDSCMFKYYEAAYEKLIKDGNFEDQRYPETPGFYTLLVWNKSESKFEHAGGKWNQDISKFEGINTEKYTIIAWQRCS